MSLDLCVLIILVVTITLLNRRGLRGGFPAGPQGAPFNSTPEVPSLPGPFAFEDFDDLWL